MGSYFEARFLTMVMDLWSNLARDILDTIAIAIKVLLTSLDCAHGDGGCNAVGSLRYCCVQFRVCSLS